MPFFDWDDASAIAINVALMAAFTFVAFYAYAAEQMYRNLRAESERAEDVALTCASLVPAGTVALTPKTISSGASEARRARVSRNMTRVAPYAYGALVLAFFVAAFAFGYRAGFRTSAILVFFAVGMSGYVTELLFIAFVATPFQQFTYKDAIVAATRPPTAGDFTFDRPVYPTR